MKRFAMVALLGSSLFALPVFVGCDSTKEEHKSVDKAPDGTTVKKEDKTVQTPGGTIEHKTDTKVEPGSNKP